MALLPGCALIHGAIGFPLTKGASYCGQQNGLAVWVDNVNGQDTPAMTCADAIETVRQAHDTGAWLNFWPYSQTWDYRVEFINDRNLGAINSLGSAHSIGYTLTFPAHDIAVAYEYDKKMPLGNIVRPSGIILMHELIHATEGGNAGHCHWVSKYAPGFGNLTWGGAQEIDDSCEQIGCSGASCWPLFGGDLTNAP